MHKFKWLTRSPVHQPFLPYETQSGCKGLQGTILEGRFQEVQQGKLRIEPQELQCWLGVPR